MCELRKVVDKLAVKYSRLSVGCKMVGSFSVKNDSEKILFPKSLTLTIKKKS